MSEKRESFAYPQSTRYGIWVVATAVLVIVGAVSPTVTPLMLAATFVSPLGLYMAVELIGSPMDLTDQLRFSWYRARDSFREALHQPGEVLALVCVAIAWTFLILQMTA